MIQTILFSLLFACNNKTNTVAPSPKIENKNEASPTKKVSSNGSPAANDGTIVATWKDGKISYGEISQEIRGKLIQMEAEYLTNRYNLERNALEQSISEKLLDKEAKALGYSSITELLQKKVHDQIKEPSETEIQAFYEQVKSQTGGRTLEQIRFQLVSSLKQQEMQTKTRAYIDEIVNKSKVEYSLPFPDVPRLEVSADDDPFKGPKDAPVTIIQFAEYQCGFCGKAGETVDQVLKAYDGKVKMVFRDFPLSFHPQAIPAAVAANCAGEQGKYWEMHNLLMSNQRELEEEHLRAHATTVKLDMGKWDTCRKDPKQEAEVRKDMEDGAKVGVSGTPAFFINGIMLSGALPFDQFKEIIDRELDKG